MNVVPLAAADGDLVVTLAAAKRHLRIELPDPDADADPEAAIEDMEIRAFRDAAIDWIETHTGRAFHRRPFRWTGANFDLAASLPVRPVRAISAIEYLADDVFVPVSADAYRLAGDGVVASSTSPWPSTPGTADCVRVVFEAGYDDDMSMPAALLAAVKMLMAHLYRNRETASVAVTVTDVPFGVATLCQAYRSWALV